MWAPKELMDEHKHMYLDMCSHYLVRYREEGNNILQWIVTCDETWLHYCQPETKRKHLLSPVAKKFKTRPLVGKLLLTIFWDSPGPILETYLERGTAVTSVTCHDMLQRGLKPAICHKIRGRLSEGILLLHNNARPHTSVRTLETLRRLKLEVVNVQIWHHLIFTFLDCLKKL
jgi:hypothetical protein